MTLSVNQLLQQRARDVENALIGYLRVASDHVPALVQLGKAMSHASLAGGKRLRPFLVLETAEMLGASATTAMPAACAIEMIHCYSLVHDDLPAMDDADLRRGRPSVHKAFDEAIAILAGDALLTDAFCVLAAAPYPATMVQELVRVLATAAGSEGMVGGQMMDLYPARLSEDEIIGVQRRKTGTLIEAAADMGAVIGRADAKARAAVREYASALGLAFQIVDDVLDVTQSAEVLGKPANADQDAGKVTFVSLLGLDGARARITVLTDQARKSLVPFGERGRILSALADELASRTT